MKGKYQELENSDTYLIEKDNFQKLVNDHFNLHLTQMQNIIAEA